MKLLAVLSFGEIAMLTAAALGTIALLFYLNRALKDQPAVLTPSPAALTTRAPLPRR